MSTQVMKTDHPRSEEVSLFDLAATLLRARRVVVGLALAGAVVGVLFTFVRSRTYTAVASFVPQSQDLGALPLAGLASQFGLRVSPGGAGESPEFYAALLRSRVILAPIVVDTMEFYHRSRMVWRRDSLLDSATLIDLSGIRTGSSARDQYEAVETLGRKIRVRVDRETSLVEIHVKSRWPLVSSGVLQRMIDGVVSFNRESRQSQAAAEREFVGARLQQWQTELRDAEDELEGFLQGNRNYRNAPALLFEHDRLQRIVGLRRQMVGSLMESYEQARIEEVRNTPVITIVEQPIVPAKANSRGLAFYGALGLILGGLMGVLLAYGRESMQRGRANSPVAYQELVALKEATVADVRRVFPRGKRVEEEE